MAGNDLRKVRRGQRLRIPAAAYNAFIDAARRARSLDAGGGVLRWRHSDLITVRNFSGLDQAAFNVLGISEPIFAPSGNVDEFCNYVGLTVTTPTLDAWTDHRGRFVVLAEPLPINAIGSAWASGVCPVRIRGDRTLGVQTAEIQPSVSGYLKPYAQGGSAVILWLENKPAEEDAWAIIRIGAPAIPAGIIVMWSGTIAPGGWTICDGGNDSRGVATPDLRGRFIVAHDARTPPPEWSDTNYDTIGNTGGEKEHALDAIADDWRYSDALYVRGEATSGQKFDNRPPYYVLAFIRKD